MNFSSIIFDLEALLRRLETLISDKFDYLLKKVKNVQIRPVGMLKKIFHSEVRPVFCVYYSSIFRF